ncbi:unnamed protein product [Arabis nemorensis]|uniref:Uncharacterized protein n=1 Tax=Arabis nemorensis TaxID=586526 RepID=A0A565CGR5_9BRAS|nr:unnamed protein product [Arabis nemorensis]
MIRRVSATSCLSSTALGSLRKNKKWPFKSCQFHGDSSVSPVLIPGVHVFHCPDVVGIVAKLSDCIAAKGGNILGYDVFVPENNNNVFYSRRYLHFKISPF